MQAPRIPMDCLFLAFALSILYLPSDAQSEDIERPVVTIPQGTLEGTVLKSLHGRDILTFLAIPYAEPPTGNLRFANPVPARGWNGIRDASADSSKCPQEVKSISGNEDCLYLNVYIPKLDQNSSTRLIPVMVYIHGGQYISASDDTSERGPKYILDKNVILVTMNYRIGALGFLSTGDEVISGNWGLKDQVLSLKWIQNNIRYFGGDPDQVTLFGESAGAASVHLLTLSSSTIGLYNKIITQGGSAIARWAYQPRAVSAASAIKFGNYVGCHQETSKSLLNCLRALDDLKFVTAYSQYTAENRNMEIVWTPTDEPDIAGAVLTDSPANLMAAGNMRDLPWISGIDRDDGLVETGDFYKNPESFDVFLENINTSLPALLGYTNLSETEVAQYNAIISFYLNDLSLHKNLLLKNLTTLLGDFAFVYPEYKSIRHGLSTAVNPRYLYSFNYRGTYSLCYYYTNSTANYGVAHGDTILYLFPIGDSYFPELNETMSETDYEMVNVMVTLWTSFATNGKPTLSPLNYTATWHPLSSMDNYLQIGDESKVTIEERHPFLKQRMQFWTDLYADTKIQP